MLFANPLLSKAAVPLSLDPFQHVKLGSSGLKTSLLGMGTGVNGYNRSSFLTRQDRNKSIAVIRHAYDRGVRLYDCADTYGTHALLREALPAMDRKDLTLVSKMWIRESKMEVIDTDHMDAAVLVERFRKEMKTDYIDLVQLHCMVDVGWTEEFRRQMDVLSELKAKGIIRAHGVSVHSLEAMKTALASPWVDVIHVRINPYGIAMDRPEPAEVVSVIHQLHNSGKGIIGMKLVGGGKLTDNSEKIDNTLRFVLQLNSVDMVIVGFQTSEQIDDYSRRMSSALAGATSPT
jgi:aryl-alcohol dehydrogenase-like predicted oxidoreductase